MDPKEGRKDTTHDSYVSALLDEFRLYDEVLDTKRKKLVGFGIFPPDPPFPSSPRPSQLYLFDDARYWGWNTIHRVN